MVLEAASHLVAQYSSNRYLAWGGALVAAYALRVWSAGYVCREERNLNNKTWILVGGFSGPGLALFHSLAVRGAQVIALHPSPSSPEILQLILLLRSTTGNERLYADECDMGDIGSIHAFVKRWEKDGRVGMMQDLEARIEGIIFCDGEGAALEGVGMGVGRLEAPAPADDPAELFHSSLLLSRHALTQLLLPTLLKSATTSPVRIISSTSPFYAARALDLTDLDYSSRPFPRWEPWLAEGHASLGSIALLRELQVRVDESRKSESGGLVVMSVCPGFTRAWFRRMLRAESTHPKFSWWGLLAYIVLFPLIWVFGKSAEEASQGMLGAVLGSVRGWDGPVVLEEEGQEEKVGLEEKINKERERESKRLRGGAVYREGREVRIKSLEDAGPNLAAELWTIESKRVEKLVARAVAADAKAQKEKEEKLKRDKAAGKAATAAPEAQEESSRTKDD